MATSNQEGRNVLCPADDDSNNANASALVDAHFEGNEEAFLNQIFFGPKLATQVRIEGTPVASDYSCPANAGYTLLTAVTGGFVCQKTYLPQCGLPPSGSPSGSYYYPLRSAGWRTRRAPAAARSRGPGRRRRSRRCRANRCAIDRAARAGGRTRAAAPMPRRTAPATAKRKKANWAGL